MRDLQIAFITNPGIKRWMQILSIIERERTFTIVSLSERLTISQRTLIKDVQSIKDHFQESIVVQSSNSGFWFQEKNRFVYQEKKEELLVNEVLFQLVEQIFYGESTRLDELAHHYSYAESTLRRFLSRIEPYLESYGLHLSLKPVTFVGEEANIRKFFFDFYYNGEQTPYMIRPPEGLHTLFLKELSEDLGNYEVGTGVSTSAFYFLLYVTMVRVQQKNRLSLPKWIKTIVSKEKDMALLLRFSRVIQKEYGVLLEEEELIWLYLMLISTRTIDRYDQEIKFLTRYNQWPALKELAAAYFSDPLFEEWDKTILEGFLASFLVSRQLNDVLYPVWNKQLAEEMVGIKTDHREAYQKNLAFLEKHPRTLVLSKTYQEDVAVSLTMMVDLLINYYQPVKHVVFLLEGEALVVQTIRLLAQRYLGTNYALLFLPLHELTEERLQEEAIDLIVTNYRPYILDYALKKEYVLMNTMPTPSDWERVQQALNPLVNHYSL